MGVSLNLWRMASMTLDYIYAWLTYPAAERQSHLTGTALWQKHPIYMYVCVCVCVCVNLPKVVTLQQYGTAL